MSSKQRIERLQFSTFRGATRSVTFDFQHQLPVVLIFGENGSGKSSIADALDFLCNNDFGSLRLRSGTKPSVHIVSASGQPCDLEVEMVYGGNTWQARLQSGKPVTSPDHPPRAFVLRRADITRIMEVTDGDRYKNLKEFITIPQIEVAEVALRAECKAISAEVDQAIQQKTLAQSTLEQYWEAEARPSSSYLNWARDVVSKSIVDLETQIASEKGLLDKLDEAVRSEAALTTAENRLQERQEEQAALEKQLAILQMAHPNGDLVSTLQAAQTYIQKHPEADSCPVCSKPENRDSLLAQIVTQLTPLRQIQDLHLKLEQQKGVVKQSEGAHTTAQQTWLLAAQDLGAVLPDIPITFLTDLDFPTQLINIEGIRTLLPKLSENRLSLVSSIEKAEKTISQYNALKTHLATLDDLSDTLQEKNTLNQRLHAMLEIVEEERKRYVQDTVDKISATVNQLYARIHPDEPIGNPNFEMKPKTMGSLMMKGKFGNNEDVPPVAYYSEAHLDTLGLCVYLALAKQSGNALVVLDDILMSIDDPHLDRVIGLINDEAPNFGHVIILTHSRAWFDRMRLGQGMQAELIELYGWDLQNGITHDHAPLAVDDLRAAVSSLRLDRQLVASRAGILLEQLLDELTLRFCSRLPRKQPPVYTLGELADGFDKNLRKLLRVEHLDDAGNIIKALDLFPLISAATADTWIRNQVGAHFNPSSAGISDAMVRKFGENVLAIADTYLCGNCHQLPRKNKSGSYWECGGSCGRTRLYPLELP